MSRVARLGKLLARITLVGLLALLLTAQVGCGGQGQPRRAAEVSLAPGETLRAGAELDRLEESRGGERRDLEVKDAAGRDDRPNANRPHEDAAGPAPHAPRPGMPRPGKGGPSKGEPGPEAKGEGREQGKADPGDKKPETPQVWKRDSKSPTFARVYVGDGNALELVSIQVTTTIEGPRARTLVDHIFRNPHARQLEGTFEYPLPTGASPSYFAMFLGQTRDTLPQRFAGRGEAPPLPQRELARLQPEEIVKHVSTADWGTLQEARVVNQQKALETYEDIVRSRIDPALLEYAGGNTFRGRVFPIAAKGYNRVLIAYEELLPVVQEQNVYRFALPNCPLQEMQFTLQAATHDAKDLSILPGTFKKDEGGSQVLYTASWKEKGPGGAVQFAFAPTKPQIQAIAGKQGESGPLYVYARVRPELKALAVRPFAERAVFLLDTSLSEQPDRFNVSMKLLQKILETDREIKQFNILAFNVGTAWVEPAGWLTNDEAGRNQALERLNGIVLEGATDFGAALHRLIKPGFDVAPGTAVNVFVLSDGQITWGEPDVAHLLGRFEAQCPLTTRFHCYRTGLGADNQELFEALTRKGGGIFNVFGQADLAAAAGAHRQQCLEVEKVRFIGGDLNEVIVAGRKAAVYPGGELIVAARAARPGKSTLLVEGKFMGQKFAEEYPVEIGSIGELAPRGWAEIAVSSLLALNDPALDSLVTAYCQQFGIASKVASFLVLENPADYKRLDLEKERGKTVPNGDMAKFLDEAWKQMARVITPKEAFIRFLQRVDGRVKLLDGAHVAHFKKMLAAQQDSDFELPESVVGGLTRKPDVPPQYLAARDANRRSADNYLTESRRRANRNDIDGAVRVLSSVVEENPTRGDALRLVGYRLLDVKQPVHAARLFERVQRARPFEPHSYLDLARALEECGKFGLAAVQYEIVLAGTWHNRFHASLKVVAAEDYARMMRRGISERAVKPQLADLFGSRLEQMDPRKFQSDLRVSISWNSDNTDVDLWVIEPSGEKCFYQNRKTRRNGELTEDVTQGYGPERYVMKSAGKGEYAIVVHYFSANPNLIAGETHVNVIVTKFAGTPNEKVERHTVILKRADEQVEVCRVKY